MWAVIITITYKLDLIDLVFLKKCSWLDTVVETCWTDRRQQEVTQLQAKQAEVFFLPAINTLFSYNLWGTSVLLLAYNHKHDFQAWKDKWGSFPLRFLEGTLTYASHFATFFCRPPPFLSFSSPSEIPLKYSGGSSSHHIFTFIVCDIKMGNYLISELWKHVCYEKTSKLSFNWCYFSPRWQGTYLFGTFFLLIELHIHIPEWRWKFHFALFCHNWDAWCVPANWKTSHKHTRCIYSNLMQLYCSQ